MRWEGWPSSSRRSVRGSSETAAGAWGRCPGCPAESSPAHWLRPSAGKRLFRWQATAFELTVGTAEARVVAAQSADSKPFQIRRRVLRVHVGRRGGRGTLRCHRSAPQLSIDVHRPGNCLKVWIEDGPGAEGARSPFLGGQQAAEDGGKGGGNEIQPTAVVATRHPERPQPRRDAHAPQQFDVGGAEAPLPAQAPEVLCVLPEGVGGCLPGGGHANRGESVWRECGRKKIPK
jgi:hypothetical protein